MGIDEQNYFFYFILFILVNIVLFLVYRIYEGKAKEQLIQDRLDSVVPIANGNRETENGLFSSKGKSDTLLERKINAILSKRSTTDEPLQLILYRCGIKTDVTKILALITAMLVFVSLILLYGLKFTLFQSIPLSLGIVFFGTYSIFNRMTERRKIKFFESLPQAVDIILRGIRAGGSIEKTFGVVAREVPSPLKEEFEGIIRELEFGVPYDRVLATSARRVDLSDYYFLVTSLIIQRQSGGSLSDVLENILYVLHRSLEMKTKVRVVSAEGRLSGIVLAALPLLIAGFMARFNPEHLQFFYEDPLGNKLLYIIFGLFFLGYVTIKRMVNIKL
jgi:tight adherence protein B